ncbi:hypothetical protein B3C1_04045 [Gallaecimonas xiamenensis 3-C-1]|uniref:Uncharacterized protein n=1 Tax=Gallaecimonas xiamenensis 3-C-1 TaxID=745411 RepID=K2J1C5_9GAMM|nr:hypothetical protein B3C1_04045 [Gallaecimonas xiamenensis 3-C-1]
MAGWRQARHKVRCPVQGRTGLEGQEAMGKGGCRHVAGMAMAMGTFLMGFLVQVLRAQMAAGLMIAVVVGQVRAKAYPLKDKAKAQGEGEQQSAHKGPGHDVPSRLLDIGAQSKPRAWQ